MGIFLILFLFVGGMPTFDFLVFQNLQECLEAKAEVAEKLKEYELTPLYLECKSDAGKAVSARGQ